MGVLLWNLEWLQHNGQRAYPLTVSATKRDDSDTIMLPNSFIVSLYLPVHASLSVESEKFYIQRVVISPLGYVLAVGYDDGVDYPTVATASISTSTHTENQEYALAGIGDFADSVGRIAIGSLAEMEDLPPGDYTFDPAGGYLEPDVVRPYLRGISSIVVVNGTDRSARLTGDIELVARANMRITVSQIEGQAPQIQFSAISGEGLNTDCVCDDELGPCIRTINLVRPDAEGNLRLAGDDCLTINTITFGLKLSDECSAPCCGCAELDAIRSQLDIFGQSRASLMGQINRVNAEVGLLRTTIISSRIGTTC